MKRPRQGGGLGSEVHNYYVMGRQGKEVRRHGKWRHIIERQTDGGWYIECRDMCADAIIEGGRKEGSEERAGRDRESGGERRRQDEREGRRWGERA